ncbi:MAG: prepilin-type N-terminal cleavage/methylation domain-containing protein [Deltaproteobacteria bacterium]|nr:prepilin-type N-terminal cleavage/methylation domain-containing protein [Deltaproteobacteria bacterium]
MGRRIRVGEARGFTLIELMVVLTIMAILVSIAVPRYMNSLTKAREAALLEDLYIMRDAIDKHYADTNEYPSSIQGLVDKKYIRTVPVDPFTDKSDTWVEVESEEGNGISDVHSGSPGVGRNAVPYNEW